MKRILTRFLALALSTTLIACGSGNSDDPIEASQPPQTQAESISQNRPASEQWNPRSGQLSHRIVAGPLANQYKVVLRWHNDENFSGTFKLVRTPQGGSRSELSAPLAGYATEFSDPSVHPGALYHYEVYAVTPNESALVGKLSVEIPKDLVISGKRELLEIAKRTGENSFELTEYNRIFFEENSVLRIFDNNLRIRAGEIISAGGTIESFPEDKKAPMNFPGRASGNLSLVANAASGALSIFLRGEDGGDGSDGAPGAQGKKGERGTDGRVDAHKKWTFCLSAGWGKPGGPGEAGKNGLPGQDGGDSGLLSVKITSAPHFRLSPETLPGRPGLGGKGGMGGKGGPGGDPGTPISCNPRPNVSGPAGPDGPSGANAPSGLPGKTKPMCIDLNGIVFGC